MNAENREYDVLIIGGGPAGLTAAIYIARAEFSVAILEKNFCGGRISYANKIENFPGFESISGIDLSQTMQKQVENLGCKIFYKKVQNIRIDNSQKKRFILETADTKFIGKSVIIANGLESRVLGCNGEEKFIGNGISYCATCDGALFKDKEVAIVGGGNTAVDDAFYLSKICKKVTMIIRKPYFSCQNLLIKKLENMQNVDIKFNSKIEEILGQNGKIQNILIKNLKNNTIKNLAISGLFLAIGYKTSNEIFQKFVKIDENGYIDSDETCSTHTEGIFCAGDTRRKVLRQLVTAVSDGANAADSAIKFLQQVNK